MSQELSELIASRELLLLDDTGTAERVFTIEIGRPRQLGDGRFNSEFRILGIPCGSYIRNAPGVDAFGSLQNAIELVSVLVNLLPHYFQVEQQRFWHAGGAGLGVPGIPPLVEGLAAYRAFDFPMALVKLRPFAEKGLAELQLILGSMHRLGPVGGIPVDMNEAERWLLSAAEQGNGQAYFELCHTNNKKDGEKDARLYEHYSLEAVRNGFSIHKAPETRTSREILSPNTSQN